MKVSATPPPARSSASLKVWVLPVPGPATISFFSTSESRIVSRHRLTLSLEPRMLPLCAHTVCGAKISVLLQIAGFPGCASSFGTPRALQEIGIDASDHVPRKLDQELIDWAEVVVATCDDSCPYIPGKHYVNWQLCDPKGQPVERVREIREDIAGRVHDLVRDLDQQAA
jgi:hypothetical protein